MEHEHIPQIKTDSLSQSGDMNYQLAGDYLNIDLLTMIGDELWSNFTHNYPEINIIKIGKLCIGQVFKYAVRTGFLSMVKYLIDKGINPSQSFKIGEKKGSNWAMRKACMRGHIDIVKLLLKDKRVNPNDNVVIRFASAKGYLDIVNLLLEDPRVDPSLYIMNVSPSSGLIGACKKGHLNIVIRLLQDPRIDPSQRHQLALYTASSYGHPEIVNYLLQDKRVVPLRSVLRVASVKGHVEIVKRLLDYNIDYKNYQQWNITSPEILNLLKDRSSS